MVPFPARLGEAPTRWRDLAFPCVQVICQMTCPLVHSGIGPQDNSVDGGSKPPSLESFTGKHTLFKLPGHPLLWMCFAITALHFGFASEDSDSEVRKLLIFCTNHHFERTVFPLGHVMTDPIQPKSVKCSTVCLYGLNSQRWSRRSCDTKLSLTTINLRATNTIRCIKKICPYTSTCLQKNVDEWWTLLILKCSTMFFDFVNEYMYKKTCTQYTKINININMNKVCICIIASSLSSFLSRCQLSMAGLLDWVAGPVGCGCGFLTVRAKAWAARDAQGQSIYGCKNPWFWLLENS